MPGLDGAEAATGSHVSKDWAAVVVALALVVLVRIGLLGVVPW
jgi:hypothetical protein